MEPTSLLYGRRSGPGPSEKPQLSSKTFANLKGGEIFDKLAQEGLDQLILFLKDGGVEVSAKPNYPQGGLGRGLIKRLFELYEEIADQVARDNIIITIPLPCAAGRIWLDPADYYCGQMHTSEITP